MTNDQEHSPRQLSRGAGRAAVDELLSERCSREDAATLARTRRQCAAQVREALNYRGRLTPRLLTALEPMLLEPTPPQIRSRMEAEGGALRHLLFQMSVMDDVLLRVHWQYLTHYEDSGRTARTWVVIGNHLGPRTVRLDPTTGELRAKDRAEILDGRDGWGGLDSALSKGSLLKASQTSALRRLLAQVGPGRDLFEEVAEPYDDAHSAQRAGVVAIDAYRPELVGVAGAGERKAEELAVKDLKAIIRRRGFTDSHVANLIRAAVGRQPVSFPSESAAREIVETILSDRRIILAADAVAPLRALLNDTTPQPPTAPGKTVGADPQLGQGQSAASVAFEPGSAEAA
jgi:hypothetical protein